MEFSQWHDHPQSRARTGGRLHYGAEARAADALVGLALAVLGERAGVPKGCFSVVTGEAKPIGEEFCHNPKIAKITFTGSTAVGAWLMREASGQIKRLSLELGGNAPFIVFDDADLDAAIAGAMSAKYRNAGQTCISANRIYVQDGVHDAFVAKAESQDRDLEAGARHRGRRADGSIDRQPGRWPRCMSI